VRRIIRSKPEWNPESFGRNTKMNANSPMSGAREVFTDGMTTQSASNLVIDNLDEFAAVSLLTASSSDYVIGSL
jgi:hypothetical protein